MNRIFIGWRGFVLAISVTLLPVPTFASITLPWSTTFNCAEWIQTVPTNHNPDCDGVETSGDWTTTNGSKAQITTDANYPGGGGGRGKRGWNGDGGNNNDGSVWVRFNPVSEFYIRWYARYEPGFNWSPLGYDKTLYILSYWGGGYHNSVEVDGWYGRQGISLYPDDDFCHPVSKNFHNGLTYGWDDMMGGAVSDGLWHAYELHLKMDTNGNNGIGQFWVDGVLRLDRSDLTFCTMGAAWAGIILNSNQGQPANGRDMFVDYDDIAIRTTGPIGLLGTGTPGTPGTPSTPSGTQVFLQEAFEDANFASRGWYDNPNFELATGGYTGSSTKSAAFHWLLGAAGPTSGGARRHALTPTETLYVSYWVKYQTGYQGSGKSYHPHEFYFLTTADSAYSGLAFNTLDFYIEQGVGTNGLVPRLEIQDGTMIDTTKINIDLRSTTEQRAVAGCNGIGNTGGATVNGIFGGSNCYPVGGGIYWNSYDWLSPTVRISTNAWHHVEVYAQMNTIANGIGQTNGILQYWLDGALIIDNHAVIMRTGTNPTLKFSQIILAPYIGDGSPIDQTFWIDDLTVASARISGDVTPPQTPRNLIVK